MVAKKTIHITILIFITILSIFLREYFVTEKNRVEWGKIESLENCDQAIKMFEADLAKNKLKYFTFGIVENKEVGKLLKNKYDLKSYHMGCVVQGSLVCYNEKVKEHLHLDKNGFNFE